jgi:hypothetical protein
MPNQNVASRNRSSLLAAIVLFIACAATKAEAQVPRATDTICQPEYVLTDGRTFSAGKASAVHLPNSQKTVLISVMHVFGPDGGLDVAIPASKLPRLVSKVNLLDPANDAEIGHAGTELLSSGEGHAADGDDSKDLVAFELVARYPRKILSLSSKPAAIGSKCWLITYVDGNIPGEYSGVVVASSPTDMAFKPDQNVVTHATSGSPVVNALGEVIGLLVGHDKTGQIWCNPGYRIRQRLDAEISAK